MKLIYNEIDLAKLGVLRCLGQATVREPVEAPNRERVTLRFRLDFFQTSYVDNAGLVGQVRAALRTQQATLLWQDDNSSKYLERTVTAAEDDEPEDARRLSGTRAQGMQFSFWYYNHDIAANTLNATLQRVHESEITPVLDMGAVESCTEKLDVEYTDKMRDVRKRVEGTLSLSGRYQANTTQTVVQRRAALQALKDVMMGQLGSGSVAAVRYGTFNNTVRITQFVAKVDQPHNYIEWSLTGTYTVYPDEAEYSIVEYQVAWKENKQEGIMRLVLSGKIVALTEAKARARLLVIRGAVVPVAYLQDEEEITPHFSSSNSGTATGGDGETFIELSFSLAFRDLTTVALTYKRTGTGTEAIDFGVVERFSDRYSSNLFDDMRHVRKRAGGMVSASGRKFIADNVAVETKRVELEAWKANVDLELKKGSSGALTYRGFFSGTVRIMDFTAEVDRASNSISWSLTASFTRFPSESDYAVCEFKVTNREDQAEGKVFRTLSGQIGAPTVELALEKLSRLRGSLIDAAAYVLVSQQNDNNRVSVESERGGVSANDKGDGETFIQLTFNEEYRKTSGGIVEYSWRKTDADDVKAGYLRTTYSGSVQAKAATAADAYAAAVAKAAELGDGKYPFKVRSDLTENYKLFLTSGALVFVTVDFSYEYQRKGTKIFVEVNSELTQETFGQNVESVSGYIMAPTLAVALTTYNTIRASADYSTALILNERKPTLAQERIDSVSQDGRFSFSFQVHRVKDSGATSMQYSVMPTTELQSNEVVTGVRGSIFAADEETATAFLDAFLQTLDLGVSTRRERVSQFQQGLSVNGSQAEVFLSLEFTETFVQILSGTLGVLESSCSEDVQYSGKRLVEKAIPTGASLIQNPGTTCGTRTITATATGTTETACLTYVNKCRAMLTGNGDYEMPVKKRTDFVNLQQTSESPRTTGAKVKLVTVTMTFAEMIPNLAYVP